MTSERRSRWGARTAEGLTIIISILLALLAEAAWQYRGDRQDERELLEGLRAEFVLAEREVVNDLAAREEILRFTALLLRARHDASEVPDADSVPDIVVHVVNWRFYTPVHAVLDDAITSGRLELIRSDEVREALMKYLQARDRLPVFDGEERHFVTTYLEPYLSDHVALDRLIDPSAPEDAVREENRRFLGLLDDDRFGSLLHLRRDRSRQARIYAREVQRAIADVQEALAGG